MFTLGTKYWGIFTIICFAVCIPMYLVGALYGDKMDQALLNTTAEIIAKFLLAGIIGIIGFTVAYRKKKKHQNK